MTALTDQEIRDAVDTVVDPDDFDRFIFDELWANIVDQLWEPADFRPATEEKPYSVIVEAGTMRLRDALMDTATPILLEITRQIASELPDLPRKPPLAPREAIPA